MPIDPAPSRIDRAPADLAQRRFFALTVTRIAGAALAVFGLVLLGDRLSFGDPERDRLIGAACVAFGALAVTVVPILLARRWKSGAR